jgi:Flp pilus assembly protein TadG
MIRSFRRRRGQSLVEMALVAPLIVFFFFGITDVGRAYYQYTVLTEAVRESARYGAVQWSNGGAGSNSRLDPAPFASIQGQIQYVAKTAGLTIVNNATNITVIYLDGTDANLMQCAHWDWARGTIVQDNLYPLTHPRTGDIVKVHAEYVFRPIVPILSQITGASFTLKSDAQMRIE